MSEHLRPAGDDVVLQLRVRRANLPALEQGIQLGIDSLTGQPIIHRLVRQDDGIYGLEVETNPVMMMAAPEAVDPKVVGCHHRQQQRGANDVFTCLDCGATSQGRSLEGVLEVPDA